MENKEEKKYEILIDEEHTIKFEGRILHRIRALKDFGEVKKGDIGGFVQGEHNLSHDGNCWIYGEAKCMDNARVCDNTKMYNRSCMFDNSIMYGNSKMYDDSIMYDNSRMYNDTMMFGNSRMYNNTMMFGNSIMLDDSKMFDNSRMYDNSKMCDNSSLHGNAKTSDDAMLKNNDKLYGVIDKPFKKIFQYQCEKRFLTAILTEENEILYSIGCQVGITKEQFIDRIYNDCREKGNGLVEYPHRKEYLDMIDTIEYYFERFKNE